MAADRRAGDRHRAPPERAAFVLGSIGRRIGVLVGAVVAMILGQMVGAGPAAAHAELVDTTPQNGAQLAQAPDVVTLEFTESVGLLDDGLRLLDADGEEVPTEPAVVDGGTVRWAMPPGLPKGAYVVNWRVLSGDSHPLAGAFSFAVGDGVAVAPVQANQSDSFNAPWPVRAARLGGYLGFTLVAGAAVLALMCWRPARAHGRTQALLRVGLVVAAFSTVLALLLQGPYAAGQPLTRLFDREMLSAGVHTMFGAWTQVRLYVLITMAAVLWPRGALETRLNQWIAAGGVVAVAITFSGTAHAAASGDLLERAVDSTHVLTAGIWAGGLVAFAITATVRGDKPDNRAFIVFSRIALLSVPVLVATGVLNSLYRLDAVESLWRSEYGRILALKLLLVVAALVLAAVSRRRLHQNDPPWRSVRLEAVTTVAVLITTSVLASVSPPATVTPGVPSTGEPAQETTVDMRLDGGRSAQVLLDAPTTGGSRLLVAVLDSTGTPLEPAKVQLQATHPEQDVGPLEITLTEGDPGAWEGEFTFPLPGTWTLTLTVEDRRQAAVVTTGQLTIN